VLLYRDGYTIKGVQKLLRGVAARPGPQDDDAEDDVIERQVEVAAAPLQNKPIQLELATEDTSPALVSENSPEDPPALTATVPATSVIASDIKAVIKTLAELRDRLRAS